MTVSVRIKLSFAPLLSSPEVTGYRDLLKSLDTAPPAAIKLLDSELPETAHTSPSLIRIINLPQVSDQSCAAAQGDSELLPT